MNLARRLPARALLLALAVCLASRGARAQDPIFADGFESGNTLAWTTSVGEPPLAPAEVFRFSDLDLRDPHLFVTIPVFGCTDFTDQDLPFGLGPSFNSQLATLITSDGNTDGFLDLSSLLEFRPFDAAASGLRLDLASGLCAAPFPPASCDPDPTTVPQTAAYSAQAAGTCLAPVAGTTSGYTPAVGATPGPCFVSAPRPVTLSLNGLPLPLRGTQLAGRLLDSPPTAFDQGLMMGFLRETDADAILLPPEVPQVGGQPLSVLLPGGSGNCAAGDDRDTFEGQSGWWFYFAFTADAVAFTGS